MISAAGDALGRISAAGDIHGETMEKNQSSALQSGIAGS
jgi:hypothetical protein